jgi:hypothetical protein
MDGFDPYRKWLGIPPQEQPPNHYRLLGIGLFESDPEVISGASDRQIFHVRTFEAGPYAEIAQFILNELAAARACLLDPQRKAEYDRWLQQMLSVGQPPLPAAMAMPPGALPEATAAPGADWSWSARTVAGPAPLPPAAPAPWANPVPAAPGAYSAGAAGVAGPRPIVVPPPPSTANPAGDFFAAVSAPTPHHGHAVHHRKKSSAQAMGIGIALATVSLVVVLVFLVRLMSQNAEPGAGDEDRPLFGPTAQTIIRHVPAPQPGSEAKSEHVVERPVQQPAPVPQPQPQPQPVQPIEESFNDIPVSSGVDRSAPPPVPAWNRQPAVPPPNTARNAPPAAGKGNQEPSGLDPDLKKDSLDKAVR